MIYGIIKAFTPHTCRHRRTPHPMANQKLTKASGYTLAGATLMFIGTPAAVAITQRLAPNCTIAAIAATVLLGYVLLCVAARKPAPPPPLKLDPPGPPPANPRLYYSDRR